VDLGDVYSTKVVGKPLGRTGWLGRNFKACTRQRRSCISGGEGLTSTLGVLCVCMKIVRVLREVLDDGRDNG
jgi:hypothetical protein